MADAAEAAAVAVEKKADAAPDAPKQEQPQEQEKTLLLRIAALEKENALLKKLSQELTTEVEKVTKRLTQLEAAVPK